MTDGERVTRIPEFGSREEEAAFWDTHDVTDYLRGAVGRIAAERGIGPSTLVRMWIKERLREES